MLEKWFAVGVNVLNPQHKNQHKMPDAIPRVNFISALITHHGYERYNNKLEPQTTPKYGLTFVNKKYS